MLYFLLIISVRSSYHVLLYTLGDSGGTRLSHVSMSRIYIVYQGGFVVAISCTVQPKLQMSDFLP